VAGARPRDAEPLVEALHGLPRVPAMAQWATFLRNHDELDLSQLTDEQRDDVFSQFAPRPDMRLFGGGIRRRLAPMFRADRRRIELAYALQFAMPGTPVLRYGEEIGMGENLALPGREAIRTPMQWDAGRGGGFSTAAGDRLVRPVVTRGRLGKGSVNVRAQQRDPDSLLRWFEQLIRTLRECPEIGVGECAVLDAPLPRSVLAHRFDAPEGAILLLHNLAADPVRVHIGKLDGISGPPFEVFADGSYHHGKRSRSEIALSSLAQSRRRPTRGFTGRKAGSFHLRDHRAPTAGTASAATDGSPTRTGSTVAQRPTIDLHSGSHVYPSCTREITSSSGSS
jgi:maltose alpha-D-glucosyltransferase / alpha-amylase